MVEDGMVEDKGVDVHDLASVDESMYLEKVDVKASQLIGTWCSKIPLKLVQY